MLPEALRAQQFLLLTKTRNCHGWKVQSNPKPSGPLQQDYAEALYLAVRTAEPTVRPVYEVTKNRRQPWSHPLRDKTQLGGQLFCEGPRLCPHPVSTDFVQDVLTVFLAADFRGRSKSMREVLPSRKLAQTPGWHRQELLICTSALDHVFWKRASVATASSSLP